MSISWANKEAGNGQRWRPAEVRVPVAVAERRPDEDVVVPGAWAVLHPYSERGLVVTRLPRRRHTDEELRETFDYLVAKWKSETEMEALASRKATNFAYQCIIGMGEDAVPLILESLAGELDDWFWALTAITRENVAEGTNTLAEAADAWIQWGKAERYVQ